MKSLYVSGRARTFGDDVNTDYIISSRRKRDTLDPQILRAYLFEDVNEAFAASVEPNDVLVAGDNFGCGSAMEVAVTVVLGAGIRAILAKSFNRTYYRNAINNGLLPVECDTSLIQEGDRLTIDVEKEVVVHNERTGQAIAGRALPDIMVTILDAGGLVPYFSERRGFRI